MNKQDPNVKQSLTKQSNKPLNTIEDISINPKQAIENSLNSLFPTPSGENKIEQARRILKQIGIKQTDEQIQTTITEFEFLINEWLDEYEKSAFEGKTLQDLLQINT